MELRNLKTFIRAAELSSFTQAAQRLGYAQSTVTAQVEALEEELGVRLFTRNGKRIGISAEGRALLRYAYSICGLEAEAREMFSGGGEPEGQLRVGILESISASAYARGLSSFLRRCPKVRLQVTVSTTLQLMELLRRGEIDVVVLLDHPVMDPLFRTVYTKPEEVLFFAAADGRFPADRPVSLEHLAGENWLLTERGCNYRKTLEDELSVRRLRLRDQLEIGATQLLIDFVAEGLGISLLPEFDLRRALETGQVARIPVSDFRIQMEIQILLSGERWASPAVRCFCQEMERVLEETRG